MKNGNIESFMGMIDVQVKEMKTMNEVILKLEKAREQDRLIEDSVQSATMNGTTNNSWITSQSWEFSLQSSRENEQSQDVSSEPWWRNRSVKITELEPGDEEPLRKFPYSIGASKKPSSQRVWVPPQPPSVALPEAAAAIRHPKSSLPIQKQHSDNDKITTSDGVAAGSSNSGGDIESYGSPSVVPNYSEIEEESEVI